MGVTELLRKRLDQEMEAALEDAGKSLATGKEAYHLGRLQGFNDLRHYLTQAPADLTGWDLGDELSRRLEGVREALLSAGLGEPGRERVAGRIAAYMVALELLMRSPGAQRPGADLSEPVPAPARGS